MEQFTEGESIREEIKNKLRQNFDGKNAPPCQGTAKIYPLTGCWVRGQNLPPFFSSFSEAIFPDISRKNYRAFSAYMPSHPRR